MANTSQVQKLYRSVVEDVINNVREAFLDEGLDDQVLLELKQIWESKLMQSKAVDAMPTEQDQVLLGQYNALQQQQKLQQSKQPMQMPVHAQPRPAQVTLQNVNQQGAVQMMSNFPGRIDMGGYGASRSYSDRNRMNHLYNRHMMPPQHQHHHVSNAAAAAAVALPPVYQQQFPAGSITLQPTDQGTFILHQAPSGTHQANMVASNTPLQTIQMGTPIQAGQMKTIPIKGVPTTQGIIQLDGANDTSSEEDDFEEDDKDDDDDEQNDEENDGQGEEEEPLNSDDDISEDNPADLFDTDNVVVCQYDKINRCKNKWKFHLKDGIMNLRGKDYVFQRANGEAEW
ncbi:transcription initiation factor IIA subunit 1-like isoform X2 [Lineus longissimus]|uniref:transcription initiation factor IIA subunit 1-like isoform X2 n=1 Tax=Lineus longissimus TaxID=88925 RepID=UPI00315DD997